MERKSWIIRMAVIMLTLTTIGMAWADGVQQADDLVPSPRLARNVIRGTVVTVDGDGVVVETADGTRREVLVSDVTRQWLPGEPLATEVELAIGDPVLILGRPVATDDGELALSARLVVVASDEDLPRILVWGRVVTVTQQTIVVQAARGERAISVLPRTRIWLGRDRVDSLRGIPAGAQVIALGQPTELGQWIAGLVLVLGEGAPPRLRLHGEVTAKDQEAGTLTLETKGWGEIKVVTGDGTRYRVSGIQGPGLADVQVGDRVVVLGRFEGGDQAVFLARGLGVVPPFEDGGQP